MKFYDNVTAKYIVGRVINLLIKIYLDVKHVKKKNVKITKDDSKLSSYIRIIIIVIIIIVFKS